MKKLFVIILVVLCIGWLASCPSNKWSVFSSSQDTIVNKADESEENDYQDQMTINEEKTKGSIEYNDSIERLYQYLISTLPQYIEDFDKEKTAWEKYQNAVREVAGYGDHGSSTPMYVADVINQGVRLREESLHYLLLHIQGESIFYNDTEFTTTMIANAYSSFIKAVGNDEYMEQKKECQESLRKEQKCWNEWMHCRAMVSKRLSEDIRNVYDISTNLIMRIKLIQLKNQNQGLGLTSGEIIKCLLPDPNKCLDNMIIQYPGFDIVWAKHCENTDWYPFE